MNRGIPRPRNDAGWPIPYNVVDGDHLGELHTGREQEVFLHGLCQTCGHTIEGDAYAVTQDRKQDKKVVLDNGLLHEACLRLALAWCPHLKAATNLRFWRFPPTSVVRDFDYIYHLYVPIDAEEVTNLYSAGHGLHT